VSVEQQVTLDEGLRYVREALVARPLRAIVVHHTAGLRTADYTGIASVRAVRRHHQQERHWSDNGFHLMVGPEGAVFLCRPLGREAPARGGRPRSSIDVAHVGDFDVEEAEGTAGLEVGWMVVGRLLVRFGLGVGDVRFHREFEETSCPGRRMDLEAYRGGVTQWMRGAP